LSNGQVVAEQTGRPGRASSIAWATFNFVVVAAITFLGLITVTFFIGRVVPIDPVLAIVGDRAPASVVAAARAQYGFDLPIWQQGYSIPIFWLGLIGLLVFYARLDWVEGPGRIGVAYEYTFTPITGLFLVDAVIQGDWAVFRDVFSHIILPASLLGYFSMAYISRMTRSFMLNELSQEYIVAARAKGLSETRVIWGHALRNAAVPLVTVVALSYATLLEGSVLTETVFAWPGIGFYLTNSLQNADMNAVLGGTIVIGGVFIALNLLSDLLYRVLDPRTRA
jgi:peptide/nickel transport system permease protein